MVRALRKNCITFFLILLCAGAICAGSDEEFFLRGNKYYAEKEYDNAFQAYDMISKKGRAVVYNMGNCSFYAQDYPRALVYWSRAQVGATPDEYNLIVRNKEIALKKLGKQQEKSWWQQFVEWLRSRLLYVSLFFLQLLFLICLWLCMVVMPKKQTGLKRVAQCSFYVFMVLLLIAIAEFYKKQNIVSAIVVKKEAMLFSGPNKSFHVLSPVAYADCACVKETREGWYKIQYAGMLGWVEADVIQVI